MTERKSGFYWYKEFGRWRVVELSHEAVEHAELMGERHRFGSRIPSPDEPWQCVPVEATDDMVAAYAREGGDIENAAFDWKTMLAAAPSPGDDQ